MAWLGVFSFWVSSAFISLHILNSFERLEYMHRGCCCCCFDTFSYYNHSTTANESTFLRLILLARARKKSNNTIYTFAFRISHSYVPFIYTFASIRFIAVVVSNSDMVLLVLLPLFLFSRARSLCSIWFRFILLVVFCHSFIPTYKTRTESWTEHWTLNDRNKQAKKA